MPKPVENKSDLENTLSEPVRNLSDLVQNQLDLLTTPFHYKHDGPQQAGKEAEA